MMPKKRANGKKADRAVPVPAPSTLVRVVTAPGSVEEDAKPPEHGPSRVHLPDERRSITRKLRVPRSADDDEPGKVYLTVGFDADDRVREVFIRADKAGSFTSGILDGLGIAVSLALQYGVPLEILCAKFARMQFEPAGVTGDPAFPIVSSILDYIGRYLPTARPK
jgi:ribonucleoside-diphosphate reductase alpha chain